MIACEVNASIIILQDFEHVDTVVYIGGSFWRDFPILYFFFIFLNEAVERSLRGRQTWEGNFAHKYRC